MDFEKIYNKNLNLNRKKAYSIFEKALEKRPENENATEKVTSYQYKKWMIEIKKSFKDFCENNGFKCDENLGNEFFTVFSGVDKNGIFSKYKITLLLDKVNGRPIAGLFLEWTHSADDFYKGAINGEDLIRCICSSSKGLIERLNYLIKLANIHKESVGEFFSEIESKEIAKDNYGKDYINRKQI